MQTFYPLQQGKTERVSVIISQLEGELYALQQEHSHMLSAGDIQNNLRDHLFMDFKNIT